MATTEMLTYSTDDYGPTVIELLRQVRSLPQTECDKWTLFILIALCLVGAFGLVGNSLSAVVFWLDKKKTATMFSMLCLAVVDAFVIISMVLVVCPRLAANYRGNKEYFLYTDAYIEAYLIPTSLVMQMMTTWFTVMVAIQRYVAVCLPYHAKKYSSLRAARKQALTVFVGCVCYNMVRFFEQEVRKMPSGQVVATPTALSIHPLYIKIYSVGLYYTLVYMIPLLLLGMVTFSLSRSLKTRQGLSRSHKEEVTLTLLMIFIVFMVCQLMSPIRRIWLALGNPEPGCGEPFRYYSLLVSVAVTFNSSFNFVIYALCSKRFRQEFLQLMGCCTSRRAVPIDVEIKRIGACAEKTNDN